MAEMNQWERNAHSAMSKVISESRPQTEISSMESVFLQALTEIFQKYQIAGKANTERLRSPSYEDPPTYDPCTEILQEVETKPSETIITTKASTGLGGLYRYTLRNKGKSIAISKREMLRSTGKCQAINF